MHHLNGVTVLLSGPGADVPSSTGYSVLEEKKLRSRDVYTVLTGSPRDESKGAVVFGAKTDKAIVLDFVIPGEQVGSYFGNSLAVTDLNNDECVHERSTNNSSSAFSFHPCG